MTRPQLGPLKPGDPVIVTNPDRPRSEPMQAHVVKAARVWIDLRETDQVGSFARTWRMRRDTQNEATGYGHGGQRFATPDQYDWDRRLADADAFLREQGIELRIGGAWREPHRRLQLAELLRTVHPAAPTA